uniref:Uncharacterized protein n=1 Tax=Arundo donax TaxID=35708 RepID=A0A0A8YKX7_ARUDO
MYCNNEEQFPSQQNDTRTTETVGIQITRRKIEYLEQQN